MAGPAAWDFVWSITPRKDKPFLEKLADDDDGEKPRKRPRTDGNSKNNHGKGDANGGSDGTKSDRRPKKSKKEKKDVAKPKRK